ncbi:MAG: nicotinate-nucleotide adenylyltransferase [Alphaproteobacteria bacterium]|nr:nicotinate-nucleotide adenylyltransferase [Alphaproteobacteria bacterium]
MIHPTPFSGSTFAGARIGLLGGSFNPAHEGHVAMSLYALKRLRLDRVWWLVSPQNPLKPAADMAPLAERLRQARLLAKAAPRIAVTAIEERLGTRYTIDTVHKLQSRMPRARFVWLMGEDNLRQCHLWQRWEALFQTVPIAVFRRPGYAAGHRDGRAAQRFAAARQKTGAAGQLAVMTPPAWLMLDNRPNPLSATQVRRQTTLKRKGS